MRGGGAVGVEGAGVDEAQVGCVANLQVEFGPHRTVVDRQRNVAAQLAGDGTAHRLNPAVDRAQVRFGAPVLHPWGELGAHPDRAVVCLDVAQQRVGAVPADVVAAGTGLEQEGAHG